MVRLLMVRREKSAKVDVISKIRCVVLGVRIRIAGKESVFTKGVDVRQLTLHNLAGQSAWARSCLFVDH
jgi:hypothetical protein